MDGDVVGERVRGAVFGILDFSFSSSLTWAICCIFKYTGSFIVFFYFTGFNGPSYLDS